MKKHNVGCLIIHGFAGARSDLSALVTILEENGYKTAVPVLCGHESSNKELSQTTYIDWIESANEAIKELQMQCNKIVIIGFSMGGLIAANIFQSHNIEAIIFINTPIYYWNVNLICRNLLCDFNLYSRKYFASSASKPLTALIQFVALLNKTKPLFSSINCPAMIFQTLDDDTVNPKSALYIYTKIKGKKNIKRLQTGGHMVFQNETGIEISNDICGFLAEISYTNSD
jgi:carboxylesterase